MRIIRLLMRGEIIEDRKGRKEIEKDEVGEKIKRRRIGKLLYEKIRRSIGKKFRKRKIVEEGKDIEDGEEIVGLKNEIWGRMSVEKEEFKIGEDKIVKKILGKLKKGRKGMDERIVEKKIRRIEKKVERIVEEGLKLGKNEEIEEKKKRMKERVINGIEKWLWGIIIMKIDERKRIKWIWKGRKKMY